MHLSKFSISYWCVAGYVSQPGSEVPGKSKKQERQTWDREQSVTRVSIKASAVSRVSRAYNPCTWVAEARGLCLEFEGYTVGSSPGYSVRPCHKKKQSKTDVNLGDCFTDKGRVKVMGQTEPQAIRGMWSGKWPRLNWLRPGSRYFGVKSIYLFFFSFRCVARISSG